MDGIAVDDSVDALFHRVGQVLDFGVDVVDHHIFALANLFGRSLQSRSRMVDGIDHRVPRRLQSLENELGNPARTAPEINNSPLFSDFRQVKQACVDLSVERKVGEAREGVFFARCDQNRASCPTAAAVLIQISPNRTCHIGRPQLLNSIRARASHQANHQPLKTRCSVQFVLLFTTVLLLAACNGNGGNSRNSAPYENGVPLIFAAASLADVLVDAAEVYESETGKRVDFSFGGSIALANQIASFGAPADGVFFVGDEPADVMVDAGLVPRSQSLSPFSNRLVVVGSKDEGPLNSLNELVSKKGRVAIGDPLVAPAGVYARRALESAGIWEEVSELAIVTLNVRAAMAAVASGNARFGIVYKTDAITSDDLSVVYEFTDRNLQISYLAVPLQLARNAGPAREFLEFITLEPEIRELFKSAGFTIMELPGQPGP